MKSYSGISPILRHALESYEHGVFHYLDGTDLGRKFSFLHIDHAIELIVKEKLVRMGKSIYKDNGKTLTIHEAFNSLSKTIPLPERPRLEDLHELRNTIQHKGLALDEFTTEFYVTEAYNFVKRFLKDELDIELQDYIPRPYIIAMEGVETELSDLTESARLRLSEAERIYSAGAYEMAVVTAFVAFEITLQDIKRGTKPFSDIKMLNGDLQGKLREVRQFRNQAVHTGESISREQARKSLDDLNEIISALINDNSSQ